MLIETLEDRRLLSATVTEGYPGFYEVHGTATDDVISIAVSQSGESFTIDGTTYGSVSYIMIHGYEGDDRITVWSDEGSGSIGASISSGGGNDTVSLNFDGAIWGGGGNDDLSLADAFYGEVYGEHGDDVITVSGATVSPIIRGGHGHDCIDASGNYAGVKIEGEYGKDTIVGSEYADQIHGGAGDDVVYGNGGNDVFYTRDAERDQIYGGDGTDIAYVDFDGDGVYEVEYVFTG